MVREQTDRDGCGKRFKRKERTNMVHVVARYLTSSLHGIPYLLDKLDLLRPDGAGEKTFENHRRDKFGLLLEDGPNPLEGRGGRTMG
jgi:hypothetical protein